MGGSLGSQCSYQEVLRELVSIVMKLPGGVTIVIIDGGFKDKLQFSTLDGHRLLRCFMEDVGPKGLFEKRAEFEIILREFCSSSKSDRWEDAAVERLASNLDYVSVSAAPHLAALTKPRPQPKDGAIVVSLRGTVLAAAARLRYVPPRGRGLRLMRQDGASAGTRHAAALDTAQWLGTNEITGGVITRSAEGLVHVYQASYGGPPSVTLIEADQ
jgi:hypothetical protein